jgi:hypothetical protein
MHDPITVSAAELTTPLRRWLRARPERPEAQASAMAYEIAALVALHADSVPKACELIEVLMREMQAQVRTFGVGVEHP